MSSKRAKITKNHKKSPILWEIYLKLLIFFNNFDTSIIILSKFAKFFKNDPKNSTKWANFKKLHYTHFSVWTNSKFWPNRIPEYYSYAIFYRIEYTNNSDLIIRIIRIIRNTFKRLKLVQILPKKLKIHRYLIMFT